MKLITGAAGRIGNVLVRALNKRGEIPRVLVRKSTDLRSLNDCRVEVVYGDILDIKSMESVIEGVDSVFHLAGYINISSFKKELTNDINIVGTKNIADLCLRNGLELVYTSSIHAIQASEDGSLITEATPLATNSEESRGLYDYSKATATKYVLDKIAKGLKAVIVHPTGVVGPFDFEPSFFGAGMLQLVKAKIKTTIDGSFDYADVRDVVEGLLKAYDLKKYGERYILSNEILNMGDYTDWLHEFSGITGKTKLLSYWPALIIGYFSSIFNDQSQITPYSVKTLYSNCNISHEKATKELGYNPRKIKDSIYDQYQWFVKNGYIKV